MGHLKNVATNALSGRKMPAPSPRAVQTDGLRRWFAKIVSVATMTRVVLITGILIGTSSASSNLNAQNPIDSGSEKSVLLTGKELHRRLNTPISISWTDAPFADRLRALAANNQFAVLIDRRINPDETVTIQRSQVTIERLLLEAANELGIGMCQVDDIIYFGPRETAQALPILWSELPRSRSSVAKPLGWNDLTTPHELINSIAKNAGATVAGSDNVHHDLWVRNQLPPLTAIQQIAIITVGFGQWPSAKKNKPADISLAALRTPRQGKLEHLRGPFDSSKPGALKSKLEQQFPKLKFQVSRDRVRMSGQTDQLYAAKSFLIQQNQIKAPNAADVRFTLKTSATRGQILNAVARQTKRELIFDPAVRGTLDEQVEIECREADLNELVDQILAGSDLKSEVSGSKIKVFLQAD